MSTKTTKVLVPFNVSNVVSVLFSLCFVLSFANATILISRNVFSVEHPFFRILDLNSETGVGTCFSTLLLFVIAGMLLLVSLSVNQRNSHNWFRLSMVFVLLTVDESVGIHEELIVPTRWVMHCLGLQIKGVLHFTWIIPGVLFCSVIGMVFYQLLLSLPVRTRIDILVAAFVFTGGAIGLEALGGWCLYSYPHATTIFAVIVIAEETTEMIGAVLFLRAIMEFLMVCTNGEVAIVMRQPRSNLTE